VANLPSSSRFLVGALLGSFAGALALTLGSGAIWEGEVNRRTIEYAVYVVFATPVMFVAFLVFGWPLFFFLRGTRHYRIGWALVVGGGTGAVASAPFSQPYHLATTFGFVAVGMFATAICWWFISQRPNQALKGDAPPAAGRPLA
jgi:hypothetical protein